MRQTAGAKALLAGAHGERVAATHAVTRKNSEGRYESISEDVGHRARWLPNITVDVCGSCNSGWMSGLEEQAKGILDPFLRSAASFHLSRDDLRVLSTWATKSWMAYALGRHAQFNPFSEAEYRAMAASPRPLGRSRIWLMQADEPYSQVALALESTLLSPLDGPPPDFETVRDNTAYAYLAVGSVVLVMLLMPAWACSDEAFDAFMLPIPSSETVRRIWPNPSAQDFPLGVIPDGELARFIGLVPQIFPAVSMPVHGLTDVDTADILRQFREGASVGDLWNQGHMPLVEE